MQRKCAACEREEQLPVQPRLEVGPAGDRYEREADAIGDQVAPNQAPRMGSRLRVTPLVQRQPRDDVEEMPGRGQAGPDAPPQSAGHAAASAVASGGRALSAGERAYFEPRFGRNFSGVRIHESPRAGTTARAIGARAYTYGHNIAFAPGEYALANRTGRWLMAHELVHTVQQHGALSVQRQGGSGTPTGGAAQATVDVTLCFRPIRRYNLSDVGAVHGVISIPDAGGALHAEVDPDQYQGPINPAGESGIGLRGGLHSHVVTGRGVISSGQCQVIPVTPAQAAAAVQAVSRYEALDVAYEPPLVGPNSNSFVEWVLHEAGVSTSPLSVPAGAQGWDHYIDNPGQRSRPPRVARRLSETRSTCRAGARATTFTALVDLLRRAETEMIANGVADVGDRLAIIRGIYYGAPWSADFDTSQSSHIRNQMFNLYSGAAQPRNPLTVMDCSLYLALADSQDLTERATGRGVDVGHMIIGMDARRSVAARTLPQPIGGASGLEAVTWAGDLGGAAARTALSRTTAPTTPVTDRFRGSDYGGSINLEGDVAGYAVGATPSWVSTAPALTLGPGQGIADAVAAYLLGSGSGSGGAAAGWTSRCRTFLEGIGGRFNTSGALTNGPQVRSDLASQIHSFGCWYLTAYQRRGRNLTSTEIERASRHMEGASGEVAEVFLQALERCVASPGSPLAALAAGAPPISPIGSESCRMARLGASGRGGPRQMAEDAAREGSEAIEDTEKRLREAGEWIDAQRRGLQREVERLFQ